MQDYLYIKCPVCRAIGIFILPLDNPNHPSQSDEDLE